MLLDPNLELELILRGPKPCHNLFGITETNSDWVISIVLAERSMQEAHRVHELSCGLFYWPPKEWVWSSWHLYLTWSPSHVVKPFITKMTKWLSHILHHDGKIKNYIASQRKEVVEISEWMNPSFIQGLRIPNESVNKWNTERWWFPRFLHLTGQLATIGVNDPRMVAADGCKFGSLVGLITIIMLGVISLFE